MFHASRRPLYANSRGQKPRSNESEPITLVLVEDAPELSVPDTVSKLQNRLINTPTKPKKKWALRIVLGIGFLVLAGNAVACEHGRDVFVDHLQSHIPAGLLFGGVVLVRRAERRVPTVASCEKEAAKEISKAVVETALFSMASAAMKTVWDAMN